MWKLKQQWNTTTSLLKWPKSGFIADKNAKWYINSEDSLAVSYKTKHSSTIRSSICIPCYLPKGVENLHPYKNLHIDIYSSFIHNCQNSEMPRCPSVGEWVNKLWYIQTVEYYSAWKINELSSCEESWRNLKCILLSERSQSEKATPCMIPTIGIPWRYCRFDSRPPKWSKYGNNVRLMHFLVSQGI